MIDKREHILITAEALFAEKGFEGTSVRELCAKAGVNVAMVSYYFGSKEQLMEALIEFRSGFMREKLDEIRKQSISASEKMELIIDHYVSRIFSNSQYHRILHRELSLQQRSQFNSIISKLLMVNFSVIRDIINDGIESKEFKNVDVELTIVSMIGTITQVVVSSFLTCKLLNEKHNELMVVTDKSHQQRVSKHLKEMLLAYLKK
jgi:AcrR family transcriptional regulator